jgi:ubiquinol-cytochrome c reductase iron-sulfur subunit
MTHAGSEPSAVDVNDPALTRFDLVREGARRDGVEIVHYAPRFPVRGTKAEKRVERTIALQLSLSGLLAFGFVAAYIWWPTGYKTGVNSTKLYTPLLGFCLGGSLLLLAFAMITWARKLLPSEVAVQERHDGGSPTDEQKVTGATLVHLVDEVGIARRPLLKAAFLLPAGGLAIAAAAPLVGSLLKNPNEGQILLKTGWNPENNNGQPIRLAREDGTPIRPEDVSVGGQMTVYPGIPLGASAKYADSPTLLIHLREQDADILRASIAASQASFNAKSESDRKNARSQEVPVQGMWENFVAYSKICTHAGCPASLYEQQTNRLLCPCHQSQFAITQQAKPIFGPATRRLPMLPLALEDGFLVARSDFLEPIGPAYWERP